MHKSDSLTTEEVRDLLQEFVHEFAALDLEYVKIGVTWHCIHPEIRDQLNNSAYHKAFEYDPMNPDYEVPACIAEGRNIDLAVQQIQGHKAPDNELPAFIVEARKFDREIQQCKALLRRDEEKFTLVVHQWLPQGLDKLDRLWKLLHRVRDEQPLQELVQRAGGDDAVAQGKGAQCFMRMGWDQRYRFILWAREVREMQAAKKLGLSDGFKDVIELVLGDEDRAIIEMPDDLTLDSKVFWPGESALAAATALFRGQ